MPPAVPAEVRTAALADLATMGIPQAAAKHGIGRNTLWRWATDEGVISTVPRKETAHQAKLRDELRELLLEKAVEALDRMNDDAKAGDWQRYSVAAAVCIDKYRLEMGEVTSREAVTADTLALDTRQVLDELASRRNGSNGAARAAS